MEEIIYSVLPFERVIANDTYLGYQYVIMNYNSNPAAYVEIPDGHPLRGNRRKIQDSIECHGGITLMENFRGSISRSRYPHLAKLFELKYVIGWDYAKFGDYYPTFIAPMIRGKMWSSEEIYNEVINVIHQLEAIRLEAENSKIKAEIEETKAETERLKQEYKSLQKEKNNESME